VTSRKWILVVAGCGLLTLGLAACGGDDDDDGSDGASGLSGQIRIDGSSTVGPLTETAAELFQGENPDVQVTVGTSGTSGGFEKFCAGETDANDASRPIESTEEKICADNGVEYEEVQVANDALSVIVNPNNPLTCITVDQLNQIWDKDSAVDGWGDIEGELDADVGDEELTLFGPGSDSGTYDYFTEEINGEEGVIRTDYNSIGEDDNAAINGVVGDEWAMAYVPFSFVQEAGETVKSLEIDDGDGCVAPTEQTVQDGTYVPLGRPLFIYPSQEALQDEAMVEFVRFYIDNQDQITTDATFIPMTEEQTTTSEETVESLAGGSGGSSS
jgi:phosphate transport system substrate-binding protein